MLKQGKKVKLYDTGSTYSSWSNLNVTKRTPQDVREMTKSVIEYVQRYKPCNARCSKSYSSYLSDPKFHVEITSGYRTLFDLSERTDLSWKIKAIIGEYIIISSNENHMLVCSKNAIRKR